MKSKSVPIDLSPRRKASQERSEETVELILKATAELLSEGGAPAVTTNKIAERAGISVGSLYHFFKNKQSIYVALFRAQLERFDERIREFFTEKYDQVPIEEFMSRLLDAVGEAYLSTPALSVLLLTMQTDPALDGISLANRTRFAGIMATLIGRRARAASSVRSEEEIHAGAVVMVETANAVFRRWMALQDSPDQADALLQELKQDLILYFRHRFL